MTAITPIRQDTVTLDASDAFRAGMRRLASGVSIVTSGTGSAPVGLIATAVCSVSIDPPTLLVSISRSSSAHPTIAASGRLCVNILGPEHRDLLELFTNAGKRAERFTGGEWRLRPDAPPILSTALAAFDCRIVERIVYSTHEIFLACPELTLVGNGAPLVHFDRQFRQLS